MTRATMSLSAQAAALVTLKQADAVGILGRSRKMKASEVVYLENALALSAETMGLFAVYEADIREMIRRKRGPK